MNREVKGILLDGYAAGEKETLLSKPYLRIKKVLDYSSVYGIVWSGNSRKLKKCLNYFMQVETADMFEEIRRNIKSIKVRDSIFLIIYVNKYHDFDSTRAVQFQGNTYSAVKSLLIFSELP